MQRRASTTAARTGPSERTSEPLGLGEPIRLGVVAAGPLDPWDVAVFPRLVKKGVRPTILGRPGEENTVPLEQVRTLRDVSPWRGVRTLERLGFKIHGFAWDHRLLLPPSPFALDDAIFGLADRARDFDVGLAFETYRASTYQACRHFRGVVVKVTENLPHNPPQVPYGLIKEAVRRGPARFACVSELARQAMLEEGFREERITVIPESVDTETFRPRDGSAALDGRLRIGFAGGLDESHGLRHLLETFRLLVRDVDATLRVAGSGPDASAVQEAATRPDLAGRVEYLGRLRYRDMPRFLSDIDVLCVPCCEVPGWRPQFGVVNIEAMACAKPVVATRVGATPEIVPPSLQRFVVPPRDTAALREALRTLALDPSLRARLGAEARSWVVGRYDVELVAEQWRSLVTEAFHETSRS